MKKNNGLTFVRKNRTIGYKIKYLYFCLFKRSRLEAKTSYGEANAEQTIYIVKPDSEDGVEGLLSLLARTSLYIRYGIRSGYQVCVDWKNYKTQYYDGQSNAWEFFFEQPSLISLDEAYRSRRVVLSGWTFRDINPNDVYSRKMFFDRHLSDELHEILTTSIDFNDSVKKICNAEGHSLDITNCLGVYLRGTDYVKLKPSGEYVQPTVHQVIEIIDAFIEKHGMIPIYLVTEDGSIYEEIKKRYGGQIRLVSFDSFIYGYKGDTVLSKSGVLEDDKKQRGIHYLVKMILLSKCKYLISSITMGSMFSYGLNGGKYEDEHIFDLGLY